MIREIDPERKVVGVVDLFGMIMIGFERRAVQYIINPHERKGTTVRITGPRSRFSKGIL